MHGRDWRSACLQEGVQGLQPKNGSHFLTLKHLGVQTSEEGMRLSTIHEVAVLRHLENWSTGSWSVEPGALAMGSRKVLGKGGWWPN